MSEVKVGLVGAGYIASWHASAINKIPGVEVVAVCDVSISSAQSLASSIGADHVYDNLDEMLAAEVVTSIHVLTPPHLHYEMTKKILEAGVNAFVEKPFALDPAHCEELTKLAEDNNVTLAVSHNFLALPSYIKLREAVADGLVGRIDSLDINWRVPLPMLRSGPFGIWMLRAPENLIYELGPHLFSMVQDLVGSMENIDVRLSKPITIPGGITHYQHWQILGTAGTAAVTLNISLVEGGDDKSVHIRGASGMARLDYGDDVFELRRANTSDIVVGPFQKQLSLAGQSLKAGFVNAWRQGKSFNRLSPYGLSFANVVDAYYHAVKSNVAIQPRFGAAAATHVMQMIADASNRAKPQMALPNVSDADTKTKVPTVMVIGGTGFIGRALVNALAKEGYGVRVFSRGYPKIFDQYPDHISIFKGSLNNIDDLEKSLEGIDVVYHLAKADEKSWSAYLKNDVDVTKTIGEACIKAGVKRVIYTGTIDSYDASNPDVKITEDTGFADDMSQRNLYARSKAACEKILLDMHKDQGLPLVIARPGIVVGLGGPLQHWGIGRWNGAGACKIWGKGDNIIPLVLVDDVAEGLVKMMTCDDIVGQSYNLIGEPMLSARGYFEAINEALASRINIQSGSIVAYYLADMVKYLFKKYVVRMNDLRKPSYTDWKSRTQSSLFVNSKAKKELGWMPEQDQQRFIERAVIEANLFGY